jgi:hypothetical protein
VSAITAQPQHMVALAGANQVRVARGRLRARIASGETTVAAVLRAVPPEAETMTIFALLMARYSSRRGRDRTAALLESLNIPEGKQVGALTVRQRNAIIDEFTPVVVVPAAVSVWHGRYRDGRLHLVGNGRSDTACGTPVAHGWREHAAADWGCEPMRCEVCATHARLRGWPVPDA